jgi:hypothetical protein
MMSSASPSLASASSPLRDHPGHELYVSHVPRVPLTHSNSVSLPVSTSKNRHAFTKLAKTLERSNIGLDLSSAL